MAKLYIAFSIFLVTAQLQAQNVNTLYQFELAEITDDIIFDSEGNLYGADYNGPNIYKVTPEGEVSIFATDFEAPNGLAFDSQGYLFMCDNTGDAIYKLDTDGSIVETYPVPSPSGIIKAFDSDTLYFTTYEGHTIRSLAPDGTITTLFSADGLNGPVGLTYDDQNRLYVANFNNFKIFRIDGNELVPIVSIPGGVNIQQGFIAFAQGYLFTTSFSNHRIYKIDPNYTDSIVAVYGSSIGNVDGTVTEAKFNRPNGIAASVTGDTLFVSQYSNGAIRIITDLTLGLGDKIENVDFEVYPNPSSGEVYINLNEPSQISDIRIFDVQGRLVEQPNSAFSGNPSSLNLNLPRGIYFLEITTENGGKGRKKIIID